MIVLRIQHNFSSKLLCGLFSINKRAISIIILVYHLGIGCLLKPQRNGPSIENETSILLCDEYKQMICLNIFEKLGFFSNVGKEAQTQRNVELNWRDSWGKYS